MSISDGQRRSFEIGMQLDAGQGMITAQRSRNNLLRLEFRAPAARDLPSLATILSQPFRWRRSLEGGRSSCVGGLLHLMRPGEADLRRQPSLCEALVVGDRTCRPGCASQSLSSSSTGPLAAAIVSRKPAPSSVRLNVGSGCVAAEASTNLPARVGLSLRSLSSLKKRRAGSIGTAGPYSPAVPPGLAHRAGYGGHGIAEQRHPHPTSPGIAVGLGVHRHGGKDAGFAAARAVRTSVSLPMRPVNARVDAVLVLRAPLASVFRAAMTATRADRIPSANDWAWAREFRRGCRWSRYPPSPWEEHRSKLPPGIIAVAARPRAMDNGACYGRPRGTRAIEIARS